MPNSCEDVRRRPDALTVARLEEQGPLESLVAQDLIQLGFGCELLRVAVVRMSTQSVPRGDPPFTRYVAVTQEIDIADGNGSRFAKPLWDERKRVLDRRIEPSGLNEVA